MEWHIKQAIDDGAGDGQIIEAIEVGIEMSGGPETASARFAMNVLEYYKTDKLIKCTTAQSRVLNLKMITSNKNSNGLIASWPRNPSLPIFEGRCAACLKNPLY